MGIWDNSNGQDPKYAEALFLLGKMTRVPLTSPEFANKATQFMAAWAVDTEAGPDELTEMLRAVEVTMLTDDHMAATLLQGLDVELGRETRDRVVSVMYGVPQTRPWNRVLAAMARQLEREDESKPDAGTSGETDNTE